MTVRENLKKKNIFLTGGSGFIGKCLVEKLLRSIPNIGNIYFLLRNKKGKSPEERIDSIFSDPIFDKLKEGNPNFSQKIVLIEGDLLLPKLGISDNDRKILVENVDIIYHSAASIRFDDPLSRAILINVRSTRDLIELAQEAKHVRAFIHVSTAYCISDHKVIEEKLYPSHGDWREAIKLSEEGDRTIIDKFTDKYIHPLQNTYVFAKLLAEHVVNDLCRGKIPAAIVRPTIVTNMADEPIPGWTDNLNGPMGIMYATGTGMLRVTYAKTSIFLDCVPVDAVVNVLILIANDIIENSNQQDIRIFNTSQLIEDRISLEGFVKQGFRATWMAAPTDMIWFPNIEMVSGSLEFRIKAILFQATPAFLIDGLLLISGKKLRLFQIQKKIFIATMVTAPFMLNTWIFKHDRTTQLERTLSKEEQSIFGFEKILHSPFNQFAEYVALCSIGIQKYIFKQTVDLKKNRQRMWWLWILDIFFKVLFFLFLIWLTVRSDILGILYRRLENYISNL